MIYQRMKSFHLTAIKKKLGGCKQQQPQKHSLEEYKTKFFTASEVLQCVGPAHLPASCHFPSMANVNPILVP